MKMNSRPTRKKDYLKEFDYESKVWGGYEVNPKPSFLGATRLKYALQSLKSVKQGKVIEIGCGAGAFVRAIKKYSPGLEVSGCDLSRNSIALAKKIGGDVSYFQADVYRLPFKSDSFDAVVSFDVWEHLERPKGAAKEVFRILKSKGLFHLYVPTEGERLSLYQLAPKWFLEAKKMYAAHLQSYTERSLKKLLSDSGFKVRDIKRSSFYIYQLVDLGYFSALRLRGKNVRTSVEGYLGSSPEGLHKKLLGSVTGIFGLITYWENELFKSLPPGGIHITAIKE